MKWNAVRAARLGWFSAVFVEFECVRPFFRKNWATPMRAGGRVCVGCLGALSGGQNMSEFRHILGVAVASSGRVVWLVVPRRSFHTAT